MKNVVPSSQANVYKCFVSPKPKEIQFNMITYREKQEIPVFDRLKTALSDIFSKLPILNNYLNICRLFLCLMTNHVIVLLID